MPPRKRRARFPRPPPVDEEFSIHEISSEEADVVVVATARAKAAANKGKQKQPPVQLSEDEDEDVEMEQVDVNGAAAGGSDEEMEMEEVDVGRADEQGYAAAYAAAEANSNSSETTLGAPVFKDGKGQPPGVLSLNLGTSAESVAAKKKRTQNANRITPRDRQIRSATHKLHALALLAHAKVRNEWLNDEALRDALFESVPARMRTDLMKIHPKRMPNQRERVRQFETFMRDVTDWWARRRFHLDPNCTVGSALRQPNADVLAGAFPPPGVRVDGWIVESAAEREARWKKEREEQKTLSKGKGKAVEANEEDPLSKRKFSLAGKAPTTDITLFGPGASATTPTYLRLLLPYECVTSPEDLLDLHEARGGSRETSAQLFCALCRALGIPARLVISLQVPSWSIAAAKVAATQGAVEKAKKPGANLPKRRKLEETLPAARRAEDDLTSDDEDWQESHVAPPGSGNDSPRSGIKAKAATKGSAANVATPTRVKALALAAQGTLSRPVSIASASEVGSARGSVRGSDAEASAAGPSRSIGKRKRDDVADTGGGFEVDSSDLSLAGEDEEAPAKGKGKKGKAATKGKGRKKRKEPEKPKEPWIPRNTEFKPRLRPSRPKKLKEGEVGAEDEELADADPVDITTPPTMWVEVFSKPWKRWITVDPVRGRIEVGENRRMEPGVNDRSNRLIYVVAFEEDGYARDVTARYTKTLHSRVSKMRPPGLKGDKDGWWGKVVASIHRKAKLERDAMEDIELGEAADREPMPSSIGAFKDHPVYAIEKHLKRDEVIHPMREVGTFQKVKVYPRANVLTCRSQKQWYNEGRVVSEGEIALKWVKSRGYTLANKRAEEQAKADGGEAPQEGLYARHQTEIYRAPPVVDGKVPTNSFGNIDLFVPSMLPAGAAHVPYNGAGKVAKKLGISYAEAITGFEFRKFRSHPRFTGIVVAQENEDMVAEAYWESEQAAAQKEYSKRQERAMKNWKRIVNALRIAKRVQQQYGQNTQLESSTSAAGRNKGANSSGVEISKLRRLEEDQAEESGGFFVDGEQEPSVEEEASTRRANGLARFAAGAPSHNGEARGSTAEAHSSDEEDYAAQVSVQQQDDEDALNVEDIFGANAAVAEASSKRNGNILSLASLASTTFKRTNGRKAPTPASQPAPKARPKPRPRIVVRRGRRAPPEEDDEDDETDEEAAPRTRRAASNKRVASSSSVNSKETLRRSGRASVKSADAIAREAQERAFAEALQDEDMDMDESEDDDE